MLHAIADALIWLTVRVVFLAVRLEDEFSD